MDLKMVVRTMVPFVQLMFKYDLCINQFIGYDC